MRVPEADHAPGRADRPRTGGIALRRRAMLLLPGLLLAPAARAAEWPSRPLRLIIPFPPGSGTDVLGRVLAEPLARALGQPVVIENRPGGNGTVGTAAAALAAPDGDTMLLISTSGASINPHTVRRLPYDPIADFAPVGRIAEEPYLLAVPPDGPVRDLRGFIARARENPGGTSFGYGNAAGLVIGSLLARMAGIELLPVPYRGGAEALADVAVGRVDANFADVGPGLAQAAGGRVRLIAQTRAERFALTPDLPPIAVEVPGFDTNVWFGLAMPAATPAIIVARANAALNAVLADPAVHGRLGQLGYMAFPSTPAGFGDYLRQQLAAWGERVRLAGIQPQ
jgi:tripartite-type tricarboxylate transporter receptor subunit TctC